MKDIKLPGISAKKDYEIEGGELAPRSWALDLKEGTQNLGPCLFEKSEIFETNLENYKEKYRANQKFCPAPFPPSFSNMDGEFFLIKVVSDFRIYLNTTQ